MTKASEPRPAQAGRKARKEDVPLPGTESYVAERPPVDHFLKITVRRRALLKAQQDYDRAVWEAHAAGVTHKLIAQASDINEASVRDRLKRIRRQREERRRELDG